jgi:hypothetical protein
VDSVQRCPLLTPALTPPSRIADTRLRWSAEIAPVAGDSVRADARTRTGDPFITSEVLYQLSYVGGWRAQSIGARPTLAPALTELSATPRRESPSARGRASGRRS